MFFGHGPGAERAQPGPGRPATGRPWPGLGPGRTGAGLEGGTPPFWPVIFINGQQSPHNSKSTYGCPRCSNHANGRCDSRLSGSTTYRNFRWCKRSRIRLRVAERKENPGPENRIFKWKTWGNVDTHTTEDRMAQPAPQPTQEIHIPCAVCQQPPHSNIYTAVRSKRPPPPLAPDSGA